MSTAKASFTVEEDAEPIDAEDAAEEPAVGLRTVPGGVIAVEHNGWEGSRPPVLRAASVNGRAGAVYWNVNRLVLARLADDGRVTATFEAGIRREDESMPSVATDDLVTDLDFSVEGPWVANSALISRRYTDVRFTSDDVVSIEEFLPILPALDDAPYGVVHDELWRQAAEVEVDDAGLVAAILDADAAGQRSFALWAAGQALDGADLDEPLFRDALQQARQRPLVELPTPTSRRIRVLQKQANRATWLDPAGDQPDSRLASRRLGATEALRAATTFPDPLDAAIGAAVAGRRAVDPEQDDWVRRAKVQLSRT